MNNCNQPSNFNGNFIPISNDTSENFVPIQPLNQGNEVSNRPISSDIAEWLSMLRNPMMYNPVYETKFDKFSERDEKLEEIKARAAQMERTMQWWSDCTSTWRDKWACVRQERIELKDNLKSTQNCLSSANSEIEKLKLDCEHWKSEQKLSKELNDRLCFENRQLRSMLDSIKANTASKDESTEYSLDVRNDVNEKLAQCDGKPNCSSSLGKESMNSDKYRQELEKLQQINANLQRKLDKITQANDGLMKMNQSNSIQNENSSNNSTANANSNNLALFNSKTNKLVQQRSHPSDKEAFRVSDDECDSHFADDYSAIQSITRSWSAGRISQLNKFKHILLPNVSTDL